MTTAVALGVFEAVQSWARYGRLFASASAVCLVIRGESDVCSAMPIYVDVSLVGSIIIARASWYWTRQDVMEIGA